MYKPICVYEHSDIANIFSYHIVTFNVDAAQPSLTLSHDELANSVVYCDSLTTYTSDVALEHQLFE